MEDCVVWFQAFDNVVGQHTELFVVLFEIVANELITIFCLFDCSDNQTVSCAASDNNLAVLFDMLSALANLFPDHSIQRYFNPCFTRGYLKAAIP